MKKLALALLGAPLLCAAAPHDQAAVIAAVKAQLKDPDSAKFRGIKEYQPGYFCGWVNAKNGFGGYTGFAVFFTGPKGTEIMPVDVSDPKLCQ